MKQIKKPGVHDAARRQNFLLTQKLSFTAQEAYRALRTNVMFALPGTGCKCIGITSATPGDGKSVTASNLAISLAQIGKKVILIDCDMRLPTIAAKFHVKSVPGLSDFLVGQARIEDAVRTEDSCGVHILPAGNIPPDPTGLLEARQLERLFEALRGIYEYVIVDLPPVVTVPDAVILSKHLDGYLLAVREKHTEHRAVKDMLRHLQMAEARIIGFVLTCSEGNKQKYKYKYKNRYQYYRYSGYYGRR